MTNSWDNFEKPDTKAARENERHEQDRRKQVRHDEERRDEERAGVSRTDVAAQVYRGRSGNVHGRSTAPAMPRHAEMNVLAPAIVAASLWLAPRDRGL